MIAGLLHRSRLIGLALLIGLTLSACLSFAAGERAWGYFSDSARLDTGQVTAHRLAAQAAPTCTDKGGIVGLLGYSELSWNHIDPRYEYRWEARRVNTDTLIGSGTVAGPEAAGTPVLLNIRPTLLDLGGLSGLQIDVRVTARLKGATGWTAPPTTTRVHSVNILLIGLSIRCGAR